MEETKTMKKKKPYVKPEMHVEEFMPNEYIAACFEVACTAANESGIASKTYTKDGNWLHCAGHKVDHGKGSDGKGCGWAVNQVISGDDEHGYTMEERNTANGTLPITITSPTSLTLKYIKDGGVIKWNTSYTYECGHTVTWHHEGKGTLTGGPNHS